MFLLRHIFIPFKHLVFSPLSRDYCFFSIFLLFIKIVGSFLFTIINLYFYYEFFVDVYIYKWILKTVSASVVADRNGWI